MVQTFVIVLLVAFESSFNAFTIPLGCSSLFNFGFYDNIFLLESFLSVPKTLFIESEERGTYPFMYTMANSCLFESYFIQTYVLNISIYQ